MPVAKGMHDDHTLRQYTKLPWARIQAYSADQGRVEEIG